MSYLQIEWWVLHLVCGMPYSCKWHDSLTSSAEDSCFPYSQCWGFLFPLFPQVLSESCIVLGIIRDLQRALERQTEHSKEREKEKNRQLDINRQTDSQWQTDRQSVVRTHIERVALQLTRWLDWPNGDVGLERGKQRLSSHDWQSRRGCTVKKCQSHEQNEWTNLQLASVLVPGKMS
jgi:hypothetical protein